MRYWRARWPGEASALLPGEKSRPRHVAEDLRGRCPLRRPLPGANPHAAWGGRPGRPPAGAALLGAWTAPPVRPFALRSRCSLRTPLRCVCGPRAAARFPKNLPRVWPAAALSPTPRAMGARGPLGEGVAFGEPRAIAGAGLRPPTTTAALGRGLLPCLRLPTGALRQCPHRRRLPPGPRRGLGRSALNGQPPLRGSPKHGPVFPSALQGKARPLTRQSASVARRRVMVS